MNLLNDGDIMSINEELKPTGYCPKCGYPIYKSDFIRFISLTTNNQKEHSAIYKCIRCQEEVNEDELIPF
jgi:DNA-directed RNA polymerase subunit RPC12/RpoP